MLSEMRLGMLLQRAVNPGRFLDSHTMLEVATLGGARALGITDKVGSLEIGKCADMIAVDLSSSHQSFTTDPVAAVVNTCTTADVLMTMVDGNVLYEKNRWHVKVEVAKNICECSKPHIANGPVHDKIFTKGGYGIVSCYNSLPLAGGGSTLVRLNLKAIAERSESLDDFFTRTLPHYCQQQIAIIDARCEFLYQQSHFFENSFLVKEGLINPERFVPMFGMYGLAEAVNLLCEKEGIAARYGKEAAANEVGYRISAQLAEFVANTPVKYGWQKRAMLHAQSGISSDIGTTPGARLPYGDEPDPITHLQTVAPHHAYYYSGISDILTLDETIKRNPQALVQLCLGAFKAGMREFTANVSGNDLVRVTGYMVRLSDLEKYRAEGSRTNTTWLGEEAARNTRILERQPRVISHEQQMRFSQ